MTNFVLDGGEVVLETSGVTVNMRYIRGIELIKRESATVEEYYLHNGHGDVEQLMNDNSLVTKEYEYDAFGVETNPDAADTNAYRYCGEYYDAETGTYYLRARYYDPVIGRFTSEDPAHAGLNWYVYCENNPIMYWDPSGYITQDEMEMFENGEMAPMAYTYLIELTYAWYLADTEADRALYHSLAEDFRATGYTTTNGLRPEVDAGILYMASLPTVQLTQEQHYFRNKLNLEYTYDELMVINSRVPEWLMWNNNVAADLHQNHTNGGPNVKWVSKDGHFEVVVDANGINITTRTIWGLSTILRLGF